jgi:serine/threonine protein kinase
MDGVRAGPTLAGSGPPTLRTASAGGVLLAERHEIRAHLGSGGMGSVYAAHDRLLDVPVAIKLVRGTLAQNQREQDRLRWAAGLSWSQTREPVAAPAADADAPVRADVEKRIKALEGEIADAGR